MIVLDTHIWVRWLVGGSDPLPAAIVQQVEAAEALCVSVLTPAIALRSVQLADIHRDPADRFIMATALAHQAQLISLDGTIAEYPEMQGVLVRNAT